MMTENAIQILEFRSNAAFFMNSFSDTLSFQVILFCYGVLLSNFLIVLIIYGYVLMLCTCLFPVV